MVGQDEMIIYQYLFPEKMWHGPDGEGQILPKGEGDGLMVSRFIACEFGCDVQLTEEELSKVNAKQSTKKYISAEVDLHLLGIVELPCGILVA
jgi:hypothetical protein